MVVTRVLVQILSLNNVTLKNAPSTENTRNGASLPNARNSVVAVTRKEIAPVRILRLSLEVKTALDLQVKSWIAIPITVQSMEMSLNGVTSPNALSHVAVVS